jgi:hypothetical protein
LWLATGGSCNSRIASPHLLATSLLQFFEPGMSVWLDPRPNAAGAIIVDGSARFMINE